MTHPSTIPRKRSLLRTVGSISSATSISRVLGLIRDQVQSFYFGAGSVTDAYLAAFRIPNLLRDLFAEGALSSAFVPTFTAVRERHGAQAAWRLANRLMTLLTAVLAVVGLLTLIFAPWILRIYVSGFSAETTELAVTMTRIVSPFLLFVALAAVAMGVLNTCGRFFVPALAPASFNVSAIVSMIVLWPLLPRLGLHPGLSLPIGALVGGVLQFAVQVPAMRREGFRFRPQLAPNDPGVRRVWRLMVPATLGLAATQINILVDTMLASAYEGAITWLQLAFRMIQLPIGLFGVAIGMANLARVSRDAALGDREAMRDNLGSALRAAGVLTIPATAGLIALREPIVRLLFEHGRFGAYDTGQTSAAVLCYSLGLYAYAVTKTQVPTFYALGETATPVKATSAAVTLKILANFALIAVLPRWGVHPFLGLALATSLAAWANFGWLALALRRRLGSLKARGVVSGCLKIVPLAVVIGVAAHGVQSALEARMLGGGGLGGEILRLGLSVGAGLAIWGAGVAMLGLPEGRALSRRLRNLLRPGGAG